MKKDDGHRLSLQEDALVWRAGDDEVRISLSDIRVMGETTNQNGPYAEDWFLCIVASEERWFEFPLEQSAVQLVYAELCARLDAEPGLRLLSWTDFASVVVWPPPLAGRAMFRFDPAPPRTRLGKALRKIGVPAFSNIQTLADEVLAYLRG